MRMFEINICIPPAGRMRTSFLVFMVSLIFLPGTSMKAQVQECWSIFRGDRALTGVSQSRLPAAPSLLWSFQTGGEIKSSPVACGDRIVAGSTDGHVYCLDLSGELKWKFNTGNAIEASPAIVNNRVYIGNLDGSLFALDLENGNKQWEYASGNQINGSVNWIEIDRQTRLFVGSYDYNLHCIDASTGKGLWKYESDNFINGAPTLYKGTAVFGGCDGFLHLVNLENGELRDKIDLATYIAGSAAVSSNLAFIGDYDGMFHCVDLEKKGVAWDWKEEDTYLPFIASPAISGNFVITGNENKYIYCFDIRDGSEKWKVNTRARVHASAVIAGDRVLAANLRGDLFLLDLGTGDILYEYELGSPVASNPALYKGKIIVGAGDGMVYCLGKK
jgi:outer membrane protein assembly factor BamB